MKRIDLFALACGGVMLIGGGCNGGNDSADGGNVAASDVAYDPSATGLGAATVQDAIDELHALAQEAALADEVFVAGVAGYGATNTMIRRFGAVIRDSGGAITYQDDAALGATFTINEAGIYSFSYGDLDTTGSYSFGLSKNSTQLTIPINGLSSFDNILQYVTVPQDMFGNVAVTVRLAPGDVVRPHTSGDSNAGNGTNSTLVVTKVAN